MIMRRMNKILSVVLAVMMLVPMLTVFMPLTAQAADKTAHVVFNNTFDFEDAVVGVSPTHAYLNRKLEDGFTTDIPSGTDNAARRKPANYDVVEETVDGVTNNYIRPNHKNDIVQMPTIFDETGVLYRQPWHITFKVKGEYGSANATTDPSASSYVYGALVAVASSNTADDGTRASILYIQDLTLAFSGGKRSPFCTLAKNQWHEITVNADPLTGVFEFRVEQLTFDTTDASNVLTVLKNGTANADGVVTGSWTVPDVSKNVASNPTDALVSLGRFGGGAKVDLCFDDISLQSVIREHVDFEDALIKNAGTKDVITAADDPYHFLKKDFNIYEPKTATHPEAYTLPEEANGNSYFKMKLNGTAGTSVGLYTNAAQLLTEGKDFTISARFMYDETPFYHAFNTIRLSIDASKVYTPLNLNYGRVGIRGDKGVALYRRTEKDGAIRYSTIQLTESQWYNFELVFDCNKWTYEVHLDGDPLYIQGSYDASTGTGSYETSVTLRTGEGEGFDGDFSALTDADMTKTLSIVALGGAVPTSDLSIYFMYGYSGFNSGATRSFCMDDVKISNTANGGTYNKVATFEYETEAIQEKVDWWSSTSFVNAWSQSADSNMVVKSTLQDWDVVDDPEGTKGKVIHPYNQATAIFSVRDAGNVLPNYVVDISFDMYINTAASTNINLFKIYPNGVAAESRDNTNSLTLVQLHSGKLYMIETGATNATDGRVQSETITLSNQTWYNIRFRMNFAEGWYEFYFNGDDTPHLFTASGVEKSRQTFSMNKAANGSWIYSTDMLDQLQFEIFSTETQGQSGDYYVDNIKIESVDNLPKPKGTVEITGYDMIKADFEGAEGAEWLSKALEGDIGYLEMTYKKTSILEDAGVYGNEALLLTGNVGGSMDVDLYGMGGYDDTFVIEASFAYSNTHGSALDIVTLSDAHLAEDTVLLSAMGAQNMRNGLTGALFFNINGNRYYICDSAGKIYRVGAGNVEMTQFTDVAVIVDASSASYAVYLNGEPAYYRLDGKAGKPTRAGSIPLDMADGKQTFASPFVKLMSCSDSVRTDNRLIVDDICVSAVKNGLTPVLVGHQENHSTTGAIRFLATVDTLYYQSVGFEVTAKGVTKEIGGSSVYSSVIANGNTYTAEKLEGRYITALVVSGIDEAGVTFTVRPFVTFFGEKIYGEAVNMVFDGVALNVAAQ